MEPLLEVAFLVGPGLGLIALPVVIAVWAFTPSFRSIPLGACFVFAALSWLTVFWLWGKGFTSANDLVDPVGHVVLAYDAATIACALSNLLLLGVFWLSLRRGGEGRHPATRAQSDPICYGP